MLKESSKELGRITVEHLRANLADLTAVTGEAAQAGALDAGAGVPGPDEGAKLATGGGRPKDLERGWYVEPTVFGDVDNHSSIAQEEIFGPVLSVIRATDESDAVRIANDTIYGLNSAVFTEDVERARDVASQLRAGTVGHNAFRTDFGIAFGGFALALPFVGRYRRRIVYWL